MTDQETFNRVYNHLKKQGKPALDLWGRCSYRTEEGLMCAVGCLISDEDYRVEFEGFCLSGIIGLGWDPKGNVSLLIALQSAHDCWKKVGDEVFWSRMERIAEEFNLKIPEEVN